MAKQSKLEILIHSNPNPEQFKNEIKSRWDNGDIESRTKLASELGYASDRSLYVILREPEIGILPGGSCRNSNKENSDDGDKTPRKSRCSKGVLPAIVERWVRDGLLADFLFEGHSSDDWIGPDEITPEIFLSHRPVVNETAAYRKILDRIGGFDSEAGKALRAWAGRPLTKAQEEQEAAERELAAEASIMPKIAKLLMKAQELAKKSGLEIGNEIAALMKIHGLVAETETETETE